MYMTFTSSRGNRSPQAPHTPQGGKFRFPPELRPPPSGAPPGPEPASTPPARSWTPGELRAYLAEIGVRLELDLERLRVRIAGDLTQPEQDALREHQDELVGLLLGEMAASRIAEVPRPLREMTREEIAQWLIGIGGANPHTLKNAGGVR